ncbi:MAG: CHAD domain-containing protein, partial [Solirubrobacteraceae bacterium]|nr:CHAD domain-containing protein [Solirubrobacteraceae bacterium]
RKAFKRGRAFVRVARPGLGDDVAARDNAALREAGQRLSGTRDAEVLVQTLDKLVARKSSGLQASDVAGLRELLVAERDAQHATARSAKGTIAEVLDLLDVVVQDIGGWTLGPEPAADLAAGFDRILRKGRRALRDAHQSHGEERTEALHELRKRSKDLWHAAELLEVAAPPEMQALQEQAHQLADYLGDGNDLSVLELRVQGADPDVFPTPAIGDALMSAISARRGKLERKAMNLADDVHSGRHKALVRAVRGLDHPAS